MKRTFITLGVLTAIGCTETQTMAPRPAADAAVRDARPEVATTAVADAAEVDAGSDVAAAPSLDLASGVDMDLTMATDGGREAAPPPADASVEAPPAPAGAVVWAIDNLRSIGGHPTTVVGSPVVIDTPEGKAVQFDGSGDALFVEHHPLARLPQFTVEIYFRPDSGGAQAQRFFHMDAGGEGRVLFETRLGNGRWVLDVFLESPAGEIALYTPSRTHPLDAWYHVAAVVDGQRARHYVNGVMEMDAALRFQPHRGGRTSIGVRINRMYYFKGAIRLARFTPRVLAPPEFLKPP